MRQIILSRTAAAVCLLCIAGAVLAGCGSRNAASTSSAAPAAGTGHAGINPAGEAYRDGIVAAHGGHVDAANH